MKKFKVESNSYLDRTINAYYNTEYLGYRKNGNPDYINHLKNMSNNKSELELVEPFIEVYQNAQRDIEKIIEIERLNSPGVLVMPRSKTEKSYHRSQLLFKKAIASACVSLDKCIDATSVIVRVKNKNNAQFLA